MKALTYQGPEDVRYKDVPEAGPPSDREALVRIRLAGICGSDLHIYHGHGFSEETDFCLGHEAVGEVVETGSEVTRVRAGDRVVVAGSIGCSTCPECWSGRVSLCQNKTTASWLASCYGLSSLRPGSQAETVCVPHADVNLMLLPDEVSDEAGVVLADNAATAWYGCRRARIRPGETVLIIGLGPVGLMAGQAAFAMGAARVLGVDLLAERRKRAAESGIEPIDADEQSAAVRAATREIGPDVVVEAVGVDATVKLAFRAVRSAGRVSVIGVSQNKAFPIHLEAAQVNELEFHTGICSVQYELPALLSLTAAGRLRPEAVITHRYALSQGPEAYRLFANREDGVSKVILDPSR